MPIIIGLICLFPLLIGVVVQYLVQRLLQKRLLRLIPTAIRSQIPMPIPPLEAAADMAREGATVTIR